MFLLLTVQKLSILEKLSGGASVTRTTHVCLVYCTTSTNVLLPFSMHTCFCYKCAITADDALEFVAVFCKIFQLIMFHNANVVILIC